MTLQRPAGLNRFTVPKGPEGDCRIVAAARNRCLGPTERSDSAEANAQGHHRPAMSPTPPKGGDGPRRGARRRAQGNAPMKGDPGKEALKRRQNRPKPEIARPSPPSARAQSSKQGLLAVISTQTRKRTAPAKGKRSPFRYIHNNDYQKIRVGLPWMKRGPA